jgi:hypothetical protein
MRATARGAVATACPAANAITARQPPWHCLVFLHGPVMAASYPAPHSAPKSCEHMDHPAVLSTGTGTRGGNDNGGGIPVVNFDVLVNGTAINGHRPSGTLAGRARIGWGFFMVHFPHPRLLCDAQVLFLLTYVVIHVSIWHKCDQPWSARGSQRGDGRGMQGASGEARAEVHFEAEPMAPICIGSGFNAVVDGARY